MSSPGRSDGVREYRFVTADVFTDRIFGGNPLAVFPEASGLGDAQMRQIARELNLSETVFVFPAAAGAHSRSLRIFTPDMELPFAGHPTIGTAVVLAAIGALATEAEETHVIFEEGVGPVPVTIRRGGDGSWFAQLTAARLPERGPAPHSRAQLARLLSLEEDALADGTAAAFSAGVPFLFIRLRDSDAVSRARLDLATWRELVAPEWAVHIYVFALRDDGGSQVHARMFAPEMGISEDPATGGAAAALPGVLTLLNAGSDGWRQWVISQGAEMGRPSTLHLDAELRDGELVTVRVGGEAVLVSEGFMRVPSAPEALPALVDALRPAAEAT